MNSITRQLSIAAATLALSLSAGAATVYHVVAPQPNGKMRGPTAETSDAWGTFLSDLEDWSTQSWERKDAYSIGNGSGPALSTAVTGEPSWTVTSADAKVSTGTTRYTDGMYPVAGRSFLAAMDDVTIDFGGPMAAFGMFVTDVGDGSNQSMTLDFLNAAGDVVRSQTLVAGFNGMQQFVGVSDPTNLFNRVRISGVNGDADGIAIDNLYVTGAGQVVPLPAASWLGMSMFGLLASWSGVRRWRRNQVAVV